MLIGTVNSTALSEWIAAIPFEEWPQQRRLEDGLIRPSMVTDRDWHGFGSRTDDLVGEFCGRFFAGFSPYQQMLSVVMPGHSIPPHVDGQSKGWKCRVHVPLLTNSKSWFWVEGKPTSMECGFAYRVDTTKEHAVTNDGENPRIHFMFDVGNRC